MTPIEAILDACEDAILPHVPSNVVAVVLLVRGDELGQTTLHGDPVEALSAALHAALLFQKLIVEQSGLEDTDGIKKFFGEMALVATAVDDAIRLSAKEAVN